MENDILKRLREPFPKAAVKWRVGQADKAGKWVKLLAYVDARVVMDRLDDVFGMDWSDEYRTHPNGGGAMCTLTVMHGEERRRVSRTDGADPSDIEGAKGVLSDAFKRAAVKFGVGRYLYEMGESWGDIHSDRDAAVATGRPFGHLREGKYWSVSKRSLDALPGPGEHAKPESAPEAEPEPQKKAEDWRKPLMDYLRGPYAKHVGKSLTLGEVNALAMKHCNVSWSDLDEEGGVALLRGLTAEVDCG